MVDVLTPDPEAINQIDIAHALSNLCRFTGHTRHFYSVAQHSVLVANLLPRELRFMGLMHDAAEAYVTDMATPLKNLLGNYRELEASVWEAVCIRFGLPLELPPEVKHADLVALATEKRDLMPEHAEVWPSLVGITPSPRAVLPLMPEDAKFIWLEMFETLGRRLR
jgi:hypothetical protein